MYTYKIVISVYVDSPDATVLAVVIASDYTPEKLIEQMKDDQGIFLYLAELSSNRTFIPSHNIQHISLLSG